MHLKFDILWFPYNEVAMSHPQKVVKELGITYQHSTPQSMGDCWWFWNCEVTPEPLPPYLSEIKLDPMECIGYGLSQEDAEKIRDFYKKPLPNEIDLTLLSELLMYSDRYEINIQFWPNMITVYIAKDGIDLCDYGGDFFFAVVKSLQYLKRVNNEEE